MIIYIEKFGKVLTSRQLGREAYAAFLPTLRELKNKEKIELNFAGVNALAPSWGDEFIHPLIGEYGEAVSFSNTQNTSVQETLSFLQEINGWELNIKS